jgi:hypothetical protein
VWLLRVGALSPMRNLIGRAHLTGCVSHPHFRHPQDSDATLGTHKVTHSCRTLRILILPNSKRAEGGLGQLGQFSLGS